MNQRHRITPHLFGRRSDERRRRASCRISRLSRRPTHTRPTICTKLPAGSAVHVYEALVKGLESAGVEAAFGGNGENIASLTIALGRSRSIRTIMARHEQAASFMACGYAMYTGRLGVCFATVGPGAFNLVSGLAVALSDSYPVLAVTGYVAREWEGHGAVNDTSGLNGTPD